MPSARAPLRAKNLRVIMPRTERIMDKRSFLLGCAAFAALLDLPGAGKAPAASS